MSRPKVKASRAGQVDRMHPMCYNDFANGQIAGRFVFSAAQYYNSASCRQSASLCVGLSSCCSLATAANTLRRRFVMEQWRCVPGYRGYQVSSLGNVRSRRRSVCEKGVKGYHTVLVSKWRLLKQLIDKSGYSYVNLYNRDGMKSIKIHSLVLAVFVGPRPSGFHACHNDGDRNNNCLENLRWDTPRSNYDDDIRHGIKCGEKNGRSKLFPDDVREIRRLRSLGVTYIELGKRFNISSAHARNIAIGESWSHIK